MLCTFQVRDCAHMWCTSVYAVRPRYCILSNYVLIHVQCNITGFLAQDDHAAVIQALQDELDAAREETIARERQLTTLQDEVSGNLSIMNCS